MDEWLQIKLQQSVARQMSYPNYPGLGKLIKKKHINNIYTANRLNIIRTLAYISFPLLLLVGTWHHLIHKFQ